MSGKLAGQVGELRMTLVIKRAATGKEETVELIGKVMNEEEENGIDSQHEREGRGDERGG